MSTDNRQRNKILLLLFGLVFLIYGNSIKNGYAFDDNYVTVTTPEHPNNPRIAKGFKGIPEIFRTHYVEMDQQSFEYRPLVLASFAVEYQLFGSNAHTSHLINVLLYALTCALLFVILTKLLGRRGLWPPLLITLLFLVHPLHTEVVANIKCRDELLAFLFGLLSMRFALKAVAARPLPNFLLSALCFFIAYLSKPTTVLFVVLIPMTLYFFTDVSYKKTALTLAVLVAAMLAQKLFKLALIDDASRLRQYVFFENPLFFEKFTARLPMALYTLGYYARLLICPYPLSCYYGYNTLPLAGWASPWVIASLLLYVGLFVYAIKGFRQKSVFSYGILFYLVALAPFANVYTPVVGIVGERFAYLASLGFCIVIAFALMRLLKVNEQAPLRLKGLKPVFTVCLAFLLLSGSAMTISRNSRWKDEISLLRNDVKRFNNSCNLHYLTGNKLYPMIFSLPKGPRQDSVIREATYHFVEAAKLMTEGVKKYPADYTTLNNIGTIYVNILNDAPAAQPFFRRSLAVKPDNMLAQYNYAFCYEKMGMPDSALVLYEKMVSAHTDYLPVYLQLRELYLAKKEYAKTLACDREAVSLKPSEARLHVNLGNTWLVMKDTLQGIAQFEEAVALEPSNAALRSQITSFLRSSGYADRAAKLEN